MRGKCFWAVHPSTVLFMADFVSPPKYPSTPHLPFSPGRGRLVWSAAETVDRFVGSGVVVTEKLDGGNTAIYDGRVFARSVAVPTGHRSFDLVKNLWAWKTSGVKDLVLYGENLYAVHSVRYAAMRPEVTFRLFAVLNLRSACFESWETVEAVADRFGVPTVPVVERFGVLSKTDLDRWGCVAKDPGSYRRSDLGGVDGSEGWVWRLVSGFSVRDFGVSVAKIVRPHHVRSSQHWTRDWEPVRLL